MARTSIRVALWIAVIFYASCLDLKDIWTDEGARYILMSGGQTWEQYNQTGHHGSFAGVITAVGPTSYQPLYYLTANAILRAARSNSAILLRLVNILWLLAALQGLLRFFRGYGVFTRLFALVILALNGFMLMHVMQIREYPMYVALMLWSGCLCFEVLETPGPPPFRQWWGRLAGYGLAMALLFYAHVACVFAFAAQAVILLTRKPNRPAFLRGLAFAYAVAAALVTPWLVTIYVRFPNKIDPGSWDRRQATFTLLRDSMLTGFRHLLTYDVWNGAPLQQAFTILILAGIPLAWAATLLRREALDRRALYAVLTMVFFAVFQIVYFFKNEPQSVWPRYFIAYFAGYAILATSAFAVLERHARLSPNPLWKAAAAAVFLLACTAGAAQIHYYRADPYMDTGMTAQCNWRVVTRAMIPHIGPAETIAYYFPLQAWTIGINYPNYPHELSYTQILNAKSLPVPALWILDTGVMPEFLHKTMEHLETLRYSQSRAVDIGCQCKLLQYQLAAPEVPK